MNRVTLLTFKDTLTATEIKLKSYAYIINADGTTEQQTTVYLTSDTDTAVTSNIYDYAGRLIRTNTPNGRNTRTEYFKNGLTKIRTRVDREKNLRSKVCK